LFTSSTNLTNLSSCRLISTNHNILYAERYGQLHTVEAFVEPKDNAHHHLSIYLQKTNETLVNLASNKMYL